MGQRAIDRVTHRFAVVAETGAGRMHIGLVLRLRVAGGGEQRSGAAGGLDPAAQCAVSA